ncbi:MAG: translocase FtsK [Dehalococcoidia bacterium]|nr:translocase FtsK [Dehalococcoidia bacterium]
MNVYKTRSSIKTRRPTRRQRLPNWGKALSSNLTPGIRIVGKACALILGALLAVITILTLAPTALSALGSLLGIGVAPVLATALVLGWIGWRKGVNRLLRPWWRWLGGLAIAAAGLGLASFIQPKGLIWLGAEMEETSLGGLLGSLILGEATWENGTLLLALGLLGTIVFFPRGSYKALKWLFARLRGVYRRRVIHRAAFRLFWMARFGAKEGMRLILMSLRGTREMVKKAVASRRRPAPLPAGPEELSTDPDIFGPDPTSDGFNEDAVLADLPSDEGQPERGRSDEEEQSEGVRMPASSKWEFPRLDLLDKREPDVEKTDLTDKARQLEEALASYGVEAKVVQVQVGPAVTQFGVEPGWDHKYREIKERDEFGKIKLERDGKPKVRVEEVSRTRVKVERITSLANDLALALAAPSVRIEAPVPGRRVVGVEVPNANPGTVTLRAVIESPAFQRLKTRSKLALALGKGVSGEPIVADLAKMPHLLIAGATGSGKSVCLNSFIACILMHSTPEEVRFLMIDPKRVELVGYNDVPHLLERYKRFAQMGVRNIEGYNHHQQVQEPLPYWVLVIDELADLMMVAAYEVERSICRLAQLARATGIHLIVSTQRPSVDVITGLIKANFPTRISFAVTSQVDARTILDTTGAEKLLGRGDMLYMPTDAAKPRRVQGTYLSDEEIERIVTFWASERWRYMRPSQFANEIEKAAAANPIGQSFSDDPLLERAKAIVQESSRVSTSLLQRKLRIGYPRAARLMEQLEDGGLIPDPED